MNHIHAGERGAVLVTTALLLTVLLVCAALTVDLGYLYCARAQLQNAADAAALAGIAELRSGGDDWAVRDAAADVAAANEAAASPVQLDADRDVVIGRYDWRAGAFSAGTDGGRGSAVKVVARRTDDSPAGPIALFFAPIFGKRSADVSAEAVAAIPPREVVVCQDHTYSFREELEEAKAADVALTAAMSARAIAGDRVGLVSFAEAADRLLDLAPLPAGESLFEDACMSITPCREPYLDGCHGTDIGAGITEATDLLTEQGTPNGVWVIVVVTDGMPYPEDRRQIAIDAADRAGAAGISIYTVTLTQESDDGYGLWGADAEFNAGLVRGHGRAYVTTRPENLADILAAVGNEVSSRLVD
jgi:hypothetical protein